MRLLRLAFKNATRNRLRAGLTAGGAGFLIFVLIFMLTALTAIDAWQGESDGHLRVAVMHASGLSAPLHRELQGYLESDEVRRHAAHVQKVIFFAGYWQDPAKFFTNLAADLDVWHDVWEEIEIPGEVLARARAQKNSCVVGVSLARRFDWKVGQRITLQGSPWGVAPELEIVGLFTCHDRRHEEILGFRWDYVDDLLGNPGLVSYFWLKARAPGDVPLLKEIVDGRTRNSANPTESMTEKEFIARFLEMMGNIKMLVANLGVVVLAILTLMTANTMSMAARERVTEIAVLRALGFTPFDVGAMMLGESVLLTVAGALGSLGAALLLFNVLGRSPAPEFFPLFTVAPSTIGTALVAAFVCAILSALVPAIGSARRTITNGLRQVV